MQQFSATAEPLVCFLIGFQSRFDRYCPDSEVSGPGVIMNADRPSASLSAIMVLMLAGSVCAPNSIAAPPRLPNATTNQAADAVAYDEIAALLEVKAEHYAKMARHYRLRSSGGSKQQATLDNLAWRHERLAEEHRMAALRARKLAESKHSTVEAK